MSGQALAFLQSAAVGAFVGLVYDFLRVIRYSGGRRGCAVLLLDSLFWAAAVVVLFLAMLTVGAGELRIYSLVGCALGVCIYFLTVSAYIVRGALAVIAAVARPVRRAGRAVYRGSVWTVRQARRATIAVDRATVTVVREVVRHMPRIPRRRREETEDGGDWEGQDRTDGRT